MTKREHQAADEASKETAERYYEAMRRALGVDDDEPIDEAFAETMRDKVRIIERFIFERWVVLFDTCGYMSTVYVRTRGELRDAVALAERLRK